MGNIIRHAVDCRKGVMYIIRQCASVSMVLHIIASGVTLSHLQAQLQCFPACHSWRTRAAAACWQESVRAAMLLVMTVRTSPTFSTVTYSTAG